MTPDHETRIHTAGLRAMVAEAARIRADLCASRGLPPSSACRAPELGCEGDLSSVTVWRLEVISRDMASECDSEGGET